MELGISIPTNTFSIDEFDDPLALFSSLYLNFSKRFGRRLFGGVKLGNGLDFLSISEKCSFPNFPFFLLIKMRSY